MDTPQRPDPQTTKERWRNLEAAVEKKIRGQKTPGSGSKSVKNDVQNSRYTIECKYRWNVDNHGEFYIELEMQWLEALYRHAEKQQKIPILVLEWGNGARACLMPHDNYYEHIGLDAEPPIELSSRSPTLPSYLVDRATPIDFGCIEIPQYLWVLFPWEELSWLGLEELESSKESGKRNTYKFAPGRKVSSRPFPKRSKT